MFVLMSDVVAVRLADSVRSVTVNHQRLHAAPTEQSNEQSNVKSKMLSVITQIRRFISLAVVVIIADNNVKEFCFAMNGRRYTIIDLKSAKSTSGSVPLEFQGRQMLRC
jgi:hypothetical protein